MVNLKNAFTPASASEKAPVRTLFVVFEYGGMDLQKLVRSDQTLNLKEIRHIMYVHFDMSKIQPLCLCRCSSMAATYHVFLCSQSSLVLSC